jgi:hypothetical protein
VAGSSAVNSRPGQNVDAAQIDKIIDFSSRMRWVMFRPGLVFQRSHSRWWRSSSSGFRVTAASKLRPEPGGDHPRIHAAGVVALLSVRCSSAAVDLNRGDGGVLASNLGSSPAGRIAGDGDVLSSFDFWSVVDDSAWIGYVRRRGCRSLGRDRWSRCGALDPLRVGMATATG